MFFISFNKIDIGEYVMKMKVQPSVSIKNSLRKAKQIHMKIQPAIQPLFKLAYDIPRDFHDTNREF